MRSKELVERIKELLEPILEEDGLGLYDIEWRPAGRHSCLRIFIDKEDGVTIADCEKVSNQISDVLDVEDLIHTRYLLEVSSPGLTRELKKPSHYKKSLGSVVKVVLKQPLEGRQKLVGTLLEADEEGFTLIDERGEKRVRYLMVSKAKLELDAAQGGS